MAETAEWLVAWRSRQRYPPALRSCVAYPQSDVTVSTIPQASWIVW